MRQPTTISRQELYALVWARPMIKVADEFGLSDVGLKKICKRHRIPVPGRGHWAKKHANKPTKHVRLYPIDDPAIETITMRGGDRGLAPAVRAAKRQAQARENKPEYAIAVESGPSEECHPVTVRTQKRLERAKPDEQGLISANAKGLVAMRIGPESIPRAMALIDALLKGAQARGFGIAKRDAGIALVIEGEPIGLSLSAKSDRTPHVPSERERAQKRRRERRGYGDFYARDPWPEWDYAPSERLQIEIARQGYDGLRRIWGDGKRQRLEELLNGVLAGAVAHAAAKKQQRIDQEESDRQWHETQQRRREAARIQARENARVEFMENLMASRAELKLWQETLGALESEFGALPDSRELAQLLDWIRGRIGARRARLSGSALIAAIEQNDLFPAAGDD